MRSRPSHLAALVTSLTLFRLSSGDVLCEGGRGEGDKWFDGCQWCVCQSGRPVCSPRECSQYVAHVPPCENLYSRWHDGCYFCTCGISGIECEADWACISHSPSSSRRDLLSRGKCLEPMDYRCICGVDGVPSCSAEVIDRSTYQSTLIALNLTNPSSLRLAKMSGNSFPGGDHRRTSEGFPVLSRKKRRSKTHSRQDGDQRLSEEESKSIPWLDSVNEESSNSILIDSENDYSSRDQREHKKDNRSANKRRHSNSVHKNGRNRHTPSSIPAPPSLLIATDNRCRFGARWYGGSLRCYCDISGSITCGDPSFVATRIDGFRVESKPCEIGHAWEEESTCRSCECPVSGLVICQRSPSCPLPFLIRPKGDDSYQTGEFRGGEEAVSWNRNSDPEVTDLFLDMEDADGSVTTVLDGSGGHGKGANQGTDVIIEEPGPGREEVFIDLTKSEPALVIEPDDTVIIETDDDDLEIDLDDLDGKEPGVNKRAHWNEGRDSRYTTVVTVRECKPGSRWRDGCLRCHCTRKGKKQCDDRKCPKFNKVDFVPGPSMDGVEKPIVRPMQRPPAMQGVARYTPIHPKYLAIKQPCGKFRLGQRYWKECNLCVCTRKGPRCTAKSCG